MNSVFPAAGSQFISERFDLKGSTAGRECSQQEKEAKGQNAILKDLDLAREVKLVKSLAQPPSRMPEYGFHLGPSKKAALLSQLRRDVRLLAHCRVMDYSLLVGIVNMNPHHLDNKSMRALELSELQESRIELARRTRGKKSLQRVMISSIVAPIRIMIAPPLFFGRRVWADVDSILSSILTRPLPYYGAGICGVNGGIFSVLEGRRSGNRAIYYMGLIDFLQPWTTRKVIERRLKGLFGYDTHAISCVPPEEYAARFLDFIDAHVS
jgi:1-phosphatidylinositol-4-phosphate 5-kinase